MKNLYMVYMIRNSIRYGAYDEGFGKGVQTGFNNGFTNGVKNKTLSVVTNMIKERIPINVISKVTGLTKKEIEAIK